MKGGYSGCANQGNSTAAEGGGYINGEDYNAAGSKSVKEVNSVSTVVNAHKMPEKYSSNSVVANYKDGKLTTERYYNEKGEPYLDIDYTNHGNPKIHKIVPHEHKITYDGKVHRGEQEAINK